MMVDESDGRDDIVIDISNGKTIKINLTPLEWLIIATVGTVGVSIAGYIAKAIGLL